MLNPTDFPALLSHLHRIAEEAATVIMRIYASDFVTESKEDHSPVTEADRLANDVIVTQLAALTPDLPIVSEEGDKPETEPGSMFWLVDPLDGTRSFVARDGQFTVNIALIHDYRPVLGVIQLPAHDTLYWGGDGIGAWRQQRAANGSIEAATRLTTRSPDPVAGYDIVASKSYYSPQTDAWLSGFRVHERVRAGSSLKFCRVAEAVADIYPRLGRTMEWDTGAGQAILEAAGGIVTDLEGQPLRYGKAGYLNTPFIASGKPLPSKNQ